MRKFSTPLLIDHYKNHFSVTEYTDFKQKSNQSGLGLPLIGLYNIAFKNSEKSLLVILQN